MALDIPYLHTNWQIKIQNTGGGASAWSSVSFATKNTGPMTSLIFTTVCNIFRDGLKGGWDSAWNVGGVHAVEGAVGPSIVWDSTVQEPGTAAAGIYASPAVAVVVTKQTGFAGRALRGRLYLPGVNEANIGEDGTIDAGLVSAWQALFDALYTNVNAASGIEELCLLHSVGSPLEGTSTPLTGFLVRNIAATMRPRQRR